MVEQRAYKDFSADSPRFAQPSCKDDRTRLGLVSHLGQRHQAGRQQLSGKASPRPSWILYRGETFLAASWVALRLPGCRTVVRGEACRPASCHRTKSRGLICVGASAGASRADLQVDCARPYAAERRLLAHVRRSMRIRRKALLMSFCSASEAWLRSEALISITLSGDSEMMDVDRRVLVSLK